MAKIAFLPVDDVQRIAVFRALVLGDLLCAVPALRALRVGYPRAEITLIGLPWAQALVSRLSCVDRFIVFPGHPGLPESASQAEAWPDFLARVQSRRFDLALQMHGSGGVTNPLVALFGARRIAAFHHEGAYCPDPPLAVPWPEHGHEIERCLALTDHLGLERDGLHLELPLIERDRAEAQRLAGTAPYAVLHPGAQLRSRRWPAERFAAVADALAEHGLQIVVTGSEAEAPVTQALQAAMKRPAHDLTGRTTVWELGALVEGARLVVCNDTGVSHVAAAVGTPSVVVACGSDVARWAPLDATRHRVLWQALPCRPCGHESCPTGHECAVSITPDAAIAAALQLIEPELAPWRSDFASSPGMSTATTFTT